MAVPFTFLFWNVCEHKHMSSVNNEKVLFFISSFPIVSLFSIIAMFPLCTVWDLQFSVEWNGESRHACLVPGLSRNAFIISQLNLMLAVYFLLILFLK